MGQKSLFLLNQRADLQPGPRPAPSKPLGGLFRLRDWWPFLLFALLLALMALLAWAGMLPGA